MYFPQPIRLSNTKVSQPQFGNALENDLGNLRHESLETEVEEHTYVSITHHISSP